MSMVQLLSGFSFVATTLYSRYVYIHIYTHDTQRDTNNRHILPFDKIDMTYYSMINLRCTELSRFLPRDDARRKTFHLFVHIFCETKKKKRREITVIIKKKEC